MWGPSWIQDQTSHQSLSMKSAVLSLACERSDKQNDENGTTNRTADTEDDGPETRTLQLFGPAKVETSKPEADAPLNAQQRAPDAGSFLTQALRDAARGVQNSSWEPYISHRSSQDGQDSGPPNSSATSTAITHSMPPFASFPAFAGMPFSVPSLTSMPSLDTLPLGSVSASTSTTAAAVSNDQSTGSAVSQGMSISLPTPSHLPPINPFASMGGHPLFTSMHPPRQQQGGKETGPFFTGSHHMDGALAPGHPFSHLDRSVNGSSASGMAHIDTLWAGHKAGEVSPPMRPSPRMGSHPTLSALAQTLGSKGPEVSPAESPRAAGGVAGLDALSLSMRTPGSTPPHEDDGGPESAAKGSPLSPGMQFGSALRGAADGTGAFTSPSRMASDAVLKPPSNSSPRPGSPTSSAGGRISPNRPTSPSGIMRRPGNLELTTAAAAPLLAALGRGAFSTSQAFPVLPQPHQRINTSNATSPGMPPGIGFQHAWLRATAATAAGGAAARPSVGQLTVFYGGIVNVYEEMPLDKAQALIALAGNPGAWQANTLLSSLALNSIPTSPSFVGGTVSPSNQKSRSSPPPSAILGQEGTPSPAVRGGWQSQTNSRSSPTPGGMTPHQSSSVEGTGKASGNKLDTQGIGAGHTAKGSAGALQVLPSRELPEARKASLQRFLEKRKERARPKGSSKRQVMAGVSESGASGQDPSWNRSPAVKGEGSGPASARQRSLSPPTRLKSQLSTASDFSAYSASPQPDSLPLPKGEPDAAWPVRESTKRKTPPAEDEAASARRD